ncbi:MAG TPA: AAA family ATPase [Gaiellaceae bacterium]|nr:AAA family ATPase [Gaiellaceae bacterium]
MQSCRSCGQENPAGARFCNACGAPLEGEAPAQPEERKLVTVLFVDLVGFTSRSERLDPEDVRAIQAPYFARVRGAIESFGGIVEKYIGDAVMAVFGAPVAHGDDPERAVRAALAIVEAVDDLDLRIAVNTGEALVTLGPNPAQREGFVSGDVVNTAARLQAAAPVNGVLVGEETYRATRPTIEYEEVEPVVAKGKAAPVRAWRALRTQGAPGERGADRAPMVGRVSELATLTGIWDRVVAERRPQLVTLFGAGGIGKSRLSAEFSGVVQARGGRVVRGRSLPYGEMTPYGSFAAQVKQLVGMFDTDSTEVACAKLERALRAVAGSDAADMASHLAMLIGVGREGEVSDRQTLFYSARRYVEALALEQPTLLVFEDIHVAATSMLDLLEMLASRVRDVPLLLLTQARPELLSTRPAWGGGLPAYTALQLEPLGEEDSRELARRLFETLGAEAQRLGELAETAEGNPLFVEELVSSLAEGRAESGELPTSIRNIVAARIDSLPALEREVLLDAAVVGKVFWPGAIGSASAETLDGLEGRDLIRRDPVSRLGAAQPQFAFKHQLIREVAYATLPRARRRERHQAIAVFLEEAVVETGEVAPALAQHWREAGDVERAARYYVAAGDQASRGWAKEQAALYYEQALGVIPEEDPLLRREVAKRYAVAAQASFHLPEMLAGRGGPRSAENRPE